MKIKILLETQLKGAKKISLGKSANDRILNILHSKISGMTREEDKKLFKGLKQFDKPQKLGFFAKFTITKLFILLGSFAALSAATATTFVITSQNDLTKPFSSQNTVNNALNNDPQPDIYSNWSEYKNDEVNSLQMKFKYPKEWGIKITKNDNTLCNDSLKSITRDNICDALKTFTINISDNQDKLPNFISISSDPTLLKDNTCDPSNCLQQKQQILIANNPYNLNIYMSKDSGLFKGNIEEDITASPLSKFNKFVINNLQATSKDNLIILKNIIKSIEYLPGEYMSDPYQGWINYYSTQYNISYKIPKEWATFSSVDNYLCSDISNLLIATCSNNKDISSLSINLASGENKSVIDNELIIGAPKYLLGISCEISKDCPIQNFEIQPNNILQNIKIYLNPKTNKYSTLSYLPTSISIQGVSEYQNLQINILSTGKDNLDLIIKILNSIKKGNIEGTPIPQQSLSKNTSNFVSNKLQFLTSYKDSVALMFKTLGSGKITDPDPDNNKIILSDLSIHCSDGMQPTFNSKIYTITYSNLSNPNSSVNDFDYNLQNILSRNNWVKCFVNSTSSPSNQVYRKDGKLLQILENNSTSSQSVSISFEY